MKSCVSGSSFHSLNRVSVDTIPYQRIHFYLTACLYRIMSCVLVDSPPAAWKFIPAVLNLVTNCTGNPPL